VIEKQSQNKSQLNPARAQRNCYVTGHGWMTGLSIMRSSRSGRELQIL
jgi:hypothetical protein